MSSVPLSAPIRSLSPMRPLVSGRGRLRKVFPKLGITSRRELPHALPGAMRAAQ